MLPGFSPFGVWLTVDLGKTLPVMVVDASTSLNRSLILLVGDKWHSRLSPFSLSMNSHIKCIERESGPEGRILTIWTDKRLSRPEIDALAHWLETEGYVEGRTRVRIYQDFGKTRGFRISATLVSILLFLWLMSLAICYYIFSISDISKTL